MHQSALKFWNSSSSTVLWLSLLAWKVPWATAPEQAQPLNLKRCSALDGNPRTHARMQYLSPVSYSLHFKWQAIKNNFPFHTGLRSKPESFQAHFPQRTLHLLCMRNRMVKAHGFKSKQNINDETNWLVHSIKNRFDAHFHHVIMTS